MPVVIMSSRAVKRDKWGRRAIELLAQGKDEAGMAAAEKAELWQVRAKSLEP